MSRILFTVLKALATKVIPVGSRVTCNPAPTDTDEDFLVLCTEKQFEDFFEEMADLGWKGGGSMSKKDTDFEGLEDEDVDWGAVKAKTKPSDFVSLKKGDMNLIVTKNQTFFDRFCAATTVAKRLNVLDKQDRIALFNSVIYGKPCEELTGVI